MIHVCSSAFCVSGDLSGALDFPLLTSYRFHTGCLGRWDRHSKALMHQLAWFVECLQWGFQFQKVPNERCIVILLNEINCVANHLLIRTHFHFIVLYSAFVWCWQPWNWRAVCLRSTVASGSSWPRWDRPLKMILCWVSTFTEYVQTGLLEHEAHLHITCIAALAIKM